jgi:hypothetical protein
MFKEKAMKRPLAVLMILGVVLSACAPAAAPAPAAPVVVTQIVKETQPAQVVTKEVVKEVQVTIAPTDTPAPAPTATIPPPVETGGEGCAPAATRVTWFVGLGAGSNADVVPLEKAWVDKYNKSQTDACLLLNIRCFPK